MTGNNSNKRIIELDFNNKKKNFFKVILDEIFLIRIINSHSPYMTILKIFFVVLLSLVSDKYITKNPDSVSSTFNATLCVLPIFTRCFKTSFALFFTCFVGAVVSTLGNIICGVETTTLWRVPIAASITYYLMFLCRLEDNAGGLSSGSFSALFVQLALYEYRPLMSHNKSEWLNTFVVRLLSVFTGCVCALIVNFIFNIVYYKLFFKAKIRHYTNNITEYLHEFVNEPENYTLKSYFQIFNDTILDIDYATNEIKLLFFKINELEDYKKLINSYIILLNHLSFLGYQKENLSEKEIESVKNVVKYCVMKLYFHQHQMNEKIFPEKINYLGNSTSTVINSKMISDESSNSLISNESNIVTNSSNNNEETRLNIINNEKIDINIQESLRIPLKGIIEKTNTIINNLYSCKILKN